jgi:hypothetical protein
MPILLPQTDLLLETRRKRAIRLRITRAAPLAGAYEEETKYDRAHPQSKRRNVGPCNTYNCHGLAFGTRRAEVAFADVALLLEEDE